MSDMRTRTAPGRPANLVERALAERKRVSMSAPRQKLSLPDIEGYHIHWINDYPGRLAQAQEAGYEFVDPSEVSVNGEHISPGSSDLGSRVSIVVGRGEAGGGLRAYAMKIKQELYEEDQAALQERNDKVDEAIRRARLMPGQQVGASDQGTDYGNATLKTNLRRRF
jgi:hypothetical protein